MHGENVRLFASLQHSCQRCCLSVYIAQHNSISDVSLHEYAMLNPYFDVAKQLLAFTQRLNMIERV